MGLFDDINQATGSAGNWSDGKSGDAFADILPASGSDWYGLNQNLVAKIYPIKAVGEGKNRSYIIDPTKGFPVKAPILEGAEVEYTLNWQSPFEQIGSESKAPALTAMLQSGLLKEAYSAFMSSSFGEQAQQTAESAGVGADNAKVMAELGKFEGRTGITKLNSTQTFAGMPPIKITCKLLFRAWDNAESEVMQPIKQLIQWALPFSLSHDGTVVNVLKAIDGQTSYVDALMPSKAPTMVALQYKGRIYKPMVIEAISDPITSPTTADGKYARAEVSITLSSLTAWDREDLNKIYSGVGL